MGQKIHPHVLRLGTLFTWSSKWFNDKDYKNIVFQDFTLRKELTEKLKFAGVSKIEIERSINSIRIIPHVSRPGMVIGRAGTGLEELKKYIVGLLAQQGLKGKDAPKVEISVETIKEPNLDAYLVAKNVSEQLLRRLPFKKVLNQSAERVMGAGAGGVKILLSGRVAGSEIGRREKINIGTVPLSTIRANIQYASYPCLTKKGYIGVKVWINVKTVGGKK